MNAKENISKYLVYCLVDPRNGEVRYIGKSSSHMNRPNHHFVPSVLGKSRLPVHNWIRKMVRLNLKPTIEILEDTDKENLSSIEMYYISISKKEGHRLLNLTEGGDGPSNRNMSQKTKDKISKSNKGKKPSSAAIEGAIRTNTGKLKTLEQKEIASLNSPNRKPVLCVDTGVSYNGIRQAAKILNIDHRGIGRCCSGEYNKYKGLKWVFI